MTRFLITLGFMTLGFAVFFFFQSGLAWMLGLGILSIASIFGAMRNALRGDRPAESRRVRTT
jgi:hypothetical protein